MARPPRPPIMIISKNTLTLWGTWRNKARLWAFSERFAREGCPTSNGHLCGVGEISGQISSVGDVAWRLGYCAQPLAKWAPLISVVSVWDPHSDVLATWHARAIF